VLDFSHTRGVPLLAQEGWRKAPGWSLTHNQTTLALRLFRPARDATVQLRDETPAWIAFHGALGPVTAASGPWTSSGEWWREDRWAREEWDIAIAAGMYRIYRDLASGRWFVQGVYD
jgi:protein ImuB